MSDTLLISTRKGLFTVSRKAGQWEITGADFLGDNVSITLIAGNKKNDGNLRRGPMIEPALRGACRIYKNFAH